MIRVALNRLPMVGARTGIGQYTANLFRNLRCEAGENRVTGVPAGPLWLGAMGYGALGPLANSWFARKRDRRGRGWVPSWLKSGLKTAVVQGARRSRESLRRHLHAYLAPANFDLYHEPNYIPAPCDLPTVVTLHDLSGVLFPHWHPELRVTRLEAAMPRILRSQHLITISEAIRTELIRLLGVPANRVTTIYPGILPTFQPWSESRTRKDLRPLGLVPGYFLYVGSIEPRKNVRLLMEAYCALPRQIRERHPLVLAGPWGWKYRPEWTYFEGHARHHNVRHLGYVPDRLLPALYNGAKALAFPSYYEGFGFPPLEMLACGGAVLAGDISTFRETLSGHAALVDPRDGEAWTEVMLRCALDDEWVEDLRAGSTRHAAKYSWEQSARQCWDLYGRVVRDEKPATDTPRPSIRAA